MNDRQQEGAARTCLWLGLAVMLLCWLAAIWYWMIVAFCLGLVILCLSIEYLKLLDNYRALHDSKEELGQEYNMLTESLKNR